MRQIKELKALVAENKIRDCLYRLKHVFSMSEGREFNDTLLLLAREAQFQSDVSNHLIFESDKPVHHARLVQATISMIDILEESPERFLPFLEVDDGLTNLMRERGRRVLEKHERHALYERLSYLTEKNIRFTILWIDNHPENNQHEIQLLQKVGLTVELAVSSEEANTKISTGAVDLILSDRSRGGNRKEGFDFLHSLVERDIRIPVVFYVGYHDEAEGVPPFAFGITHSPSEILHLAMDVIQRNL